jgi:hypothetical protein
MQLSPSFIYVAGTIHLVVASANIFAFGKFRYMEHLRNVPLVMRQVFLVQNAYIMLVQVGFSLPCFFFAGELTLQIHQIGRRSIKAVREDARHEP